MSSESESSEENGRLQERTLPESQLPPRKPRVVFDTSAIVHAALAPRGPAETDGLRLLDEDALEAFVSNRLRAEYERTLTYPGLAARFKNVTADYIAAKLQRVDERMTRLVNPPEYVHFARDPNDEPVLNLAIHVGADYLVSADRDLLDLGRSNAAFGRLFPFVKIVAPSALRGELQQGRTPGRVAGQPERGAARAAQEPTPEQHPLQQQPREPRDPDSGREP